MEDRKKIFSSVMLRLISPRNVDRFEGGKNKNKKAPLPMLKGRSHDAYYPPIFKAVPMDPRDLKIETLKRRQNPHRRGYRSPHPAHRPPSAEPKGPATPHRPS